MSGGSCLYTYPSQLLPLRNVRIPDCRYGHIDSGIQKAFIATSRRSQEEHHDSRFTYPPLITIWSPVPLRKEFNYAEPRRRSYGTLRFQTGVHSHRRYDEGRLPALRIAASSCSLPGPQYVSRVDVVTVPYRNPHVLGSSEYKCFRYTRQSPQLPSFLHTQTLISPLRLYIFFAPATLQTLVYLSISIALAPYHVRSFTPHRDQHRASSAARNRSCCTAFCRDHVSPRPQEPRLEVSSRRLSPQICLWTWSPSHLPSNPRRRSPHRNPPLQRFGSGRDPRNRARPFISQTP
ncbi:hypothetical protein PENSPDRAFT_471097 [Peniophora sp. CONT]|nr:hypothetical protein PENSPDRAFT_471097 [Peniophora sp. CONT]